MTTASSMHVLAQIAGHDLQCDVVSEGRGEARNVLQPMLGDGTGQGRRLGLVSAMTRCPKKAQTTLLTQE